MTSEKESSEAYKKYLKRTANLFKVCLIGDGAVGKTTFINYLSSGQLIPKQGRIARTPYVNIDCCVVGGHQLQIYDLAGQREEGAHPLDHMQAVVLKEADFLIFFFALDNLQSFFNIKKWYDEIKAAYEGWGAPLPRMLLVGNKLDLLRKVESLNGEMLVENVEEIINYTEISLFTGSSVVEFLDQICKVMDSALLP